MKRRRPRQLFHFALCLLAAAIALQWQPFAQPQQDWGKDSAPMVAAQGVLSASTPEVAFPSGNLSEVSRADELSVDIAATLGLGTNISLSQNQSSFYASICYPRGGKANFLDMPQGLLLRGYVYDTGSRLETYYSRQGSFVAFRAWVAGEGLKVSGASDAFNSTVAVASSLGIPEDLSSVVFKESISRVDHIDGKKSWTNQTTVMLSSGPIGGLPISHFNMIGAEFDDDLKSIKYLESWLFVRPSINWAISVETAMTVGRNASLNAVPEEYRLFRNESIESVQLVVDKMSIGYKYLSFWGRDEVDMGLWIYASVVVVDPEDGSVLSVYIYLRTWEPEPRQIILEGWIPYLSILAIGSVAILGLALLRPEAMSLVFAALIIPLYIRMRGAKALNNFSRGKVYGFILARPGTTLTELKSELSVGTGGLVYNLQVLEYLELIKSVKEGKFRRYYPVGVRVSVGVEHHIGSSEAEVLSKIEKSGPIANVDLAKSLGYSRQRTHYNLKLLRHRGLVENIGPMWRRVVPDEMSSREEQTNKGKDAETLRTPGQ